MADKEFTEMPVWEKEFTLLMKVYKLTKTYPKDEKFWIT